MNSPDLPVIAEGSSQDLLRYLKHQLQTFFPSVCNGDKDDQPDLRLLDIHLPEALRKVGYCIDQVRMWQPGRFSFLHSSQYCQFLYYLAHTVWRHEQQRELCTRLFLLNKMLNGIDLFYEIEMPEVFFIGHSVGIVLAKASYGNHLVLYQNSTIGKNHGHGPVIGNGVILYPNTAIIGKCHVGDGTTISQGASLIDQDSPGSCLVFRGAGAGAVTKPTARRYIDDYFRSA